MVSSDTIITIISAIVFAVIGCLTGILGWLLVRNQGQVDSHVRSLWKAIDDERREKTEISNRLASAEVTIERATSRISALEYRRKQ